MEPSVEKGPIIKTFAFKIKESTSNWVAVGVCHRELVKGKGYGFNFGSIGHGGYMISANGGSWSNSKIEVNNIVKVSMMLMVVIQIFKRRHYICDCQYEFEKDPF